jgi:hypothetical protein
MIKYIPFINAYALHERLNRHEREEKKSKVVSCRSEHGTSNDTMDYNNMNARPR